MLPERFQTWQELGVFARIRQRLVKYYAKKRNVKWKWQAIDSKACPAPLGGEDTGRNPTDRGKQARSTCWSLSAARLLRCSSLALTGTIRPLL
ncbi:MAG: hypothetical protein OXH85_07560 [Truepera sp.]|nr:hypothetical protein [Truepera sp.]